MGWYIETPGQHHGKAERIAADYDGEVVTKPESFEDIPEGKGVVVVTNNGPFEAAGFAYDAHEFEAFTRPDDPRSKKYVLLDWDKAAELSGYAAYTAEHAD